MLQALRKQYQDDEVTLEIGLRWQINGAEDFLCTQYDGMIWNINDEHPEPVTDTHPNCVCELIQMEVLRTP